MYSETMSYKLPLLENNIYGWTVHATLSDTPPPALIPLPLTSNEREHSFISTTVPETWL
jgi:hypothetical protein